MKPNIPFCKFMSVILLIVIPISALALDYTYHNFGEGGGIAITSYRGDGGAQGAVSASGCGRDA